MKTHLLNTIITPLTGAGALLLLTATCPAMEIIAGSFGGCGTSGSASYITMGTTNPAAAGPSGSESVTASPGPIAAAFKPSLAGTPKAHLILTSPGVLTLVAVPDLPGWYWEQSDDLVKWTPIATPAQNPVLVPIDQQRRFFRRQKS